MTSNFPLNPKYCKSLIFLLCWIYPAQIILMGSTSPSLGPKTQPFNHLLPPNSLEREREMSRELENPKIWRYTWEAQSHLPILKLFLFNPEIDPSTHCKTIKSQLIIEKSLLRTTWFEGETEVIIDVPIPRVLVDTEAPIQYKVLGDHIEVRLVLLLPADHPICIEFDSATSLDKEEFVNENGVFDSGLISIETDLKRLSLDLEGVCFYCRSCLAQLTRPIKSFTEMPSTNWSEVADNWFGGCCCSFGGVSDKLVAKYANSYASTPGTCLLSTTFVVLYKDDLVGRNFTCDVVEDVRNAKSCEEGTLNNGGTKVASNLECHRQGLNTTGENICNISTASELTPDVSSASKCCDGAHCLVHSTENGCFETSGTYLEDQPLIKTFELPENQKSFLNGFLGDIFMARSSSLSKEVCWVEILCPQCCSFLGAYPADNRGNILDGGFRLFKCYISTCLPTGGGSHDAFRKYTLERMFTNQLVENAKTELSYRTVIRDLQTKSAMMQIVLLNPSSFIRTGYCSVSENESQSVDKVDLSSAIKVLFSDCSGDGVSQTRLVEEWVEKNQADEVYMFAHQIKELIKTLHSAKNMFPLSCTSLQGLLLSSLRR